MDLYSPNVSSLTSYLTDSISAIYFFSGHFSHYNRAAVSQAIITGCAKMAKTTLRNFIALHACSEFKRIHNSNLFYFSFVLEIHGEKLSYDNYTNSLNNPIALIRFRNINIKKKNNLITIPNKYIHVLRCISNKVPRYTNDCTIG